ncbi:MAG: TRAP transporter permease [Proteobacteria bacterium]|nr:TRAP transporter permease [Pseudomonadota bacterium]
MSNSTNQANQKDGVQLAQEIAKESEYGSRSPQGFEAYYIPVIAFAWSIFQLSLASFLTLPSIHIRTIHLAFAITLAFLSYPTLRKKRKGFFALFSARDRFTVIDYILAITAPIAVLYLSVDYLGIAERMGNPIPRDIFIGVILIVLLLEAARRALGPALTVVASVFVFYAFFGPYMPEVIAFKGVSLRRFMGQISMSSEGIFGVPLDVSANIVFLFVLFGAMLEKAGGGEYFVQLAFGLLGRFRGGPAKASVCASAMTGMISGSSIANTVTTGTFTIPLIKKVGYPSHKAAAVEVASSTNGQLTPPIMGAAAFIIAEYTNLEYFEVIKAAAVPALVSYIGLLYITHLEALKLGLKGLSKDQLPQIWNTFKGGIHYLVPLTLLIFELMVMRRSPEYSAFKAIIVLGVIMLFQQPVKARFGIEHHGKKAKPRMEGFIAGILEIKDGLVAGGRNMISIGVATAAAGIIVGVVTMGLGGLINDIIDLLSGGNILLLLFITAVASLILGMGLPTTANYIVMASLTAPVIVTVGSANGLVVPLIAAHLFVFYFGILADDTPPVGLAAFAASAIAKSDPIKTGVQGFMYDIRTAILPFMFIFNTEILLIGVDNIAHGFLIFGMCTLGMLTFTAATQNHFVTKNRYWETAILILLTLMFMRPQFFTQNFDAVMPMSTKIKIVAELDGKISPIIKEFDEKSEELVELKDEFASLVGLLNKEEKEQLRQTLNIPELSSTSFEEAVSQWDFDQNKAQNLLNQVNKFGTPPFTTYILAILIYLGVFGWQRRRLAKEDSNLAYA